MMTLETYRNGPNVLLTTIGPDTDKCLAPGRWVSQGSGDDTLGLGIVVAVTEDEVAVLWSIAPYQNPMSIINEDFFDAIRMSTGMLCDLGGETQRAKEEIDVFTQKVRQMLRRRK